MLKKLISTSLFALGLLLVPSVHAVWFDAASLTEFEWNRNDRAFFPLYIDATEDGEITADNDLVLRLPVGAAIQWEREQPTISFQGTASGKVAADVTVSDDLYSLAIDVTEDFAKDERLEVHGAMPRTFSEDVADQSLQLDYDADDENDVANVQIFRVDDENTDFIKPYQPEDLTAVYDHEKNEVTLNWVNPRNYDFVEVILRRERDRDGAISMKDIYNGPASTFIDRSVITAIDFKLGDNITYYLRAKDTEDNRTDEISFYIELNEPGSEPEPEEEEMEEEQQEDGEPAPQPDPDADPDDVDKATRLFNYYDVRYQIKCLSQSAIERGAPDDSICRDAKVDIVYAQQILGRSDVDVSLSERDLELMALRVRWPEMRYQTRCIEADEPHRTCDALEEGLKRIRYFID